MTVPFAFANLSGTIALSKLDSNFNTPITIGNTSVQLGNTITTVNNLTLANVTITSGTSNVTNVNVTSINVTNVTATLANITTLNATSAFITTGNIATANVGNLSLLNPLTVPNGGTGRVTLPVSNVLLGNGTGSITSVAPGNAGNVLTSVGGVWVSNALVSLSVGGSNGQVQYNNANLLAGSANLTFDGTNLGIGSATPTNKLEVSGSARFFLAANGDVLISHSGLVSSITSATSVSLAFGTGNTERARFNTTGAFVFAGGDTSANGIGITFPATQSASTNANTLDDYEEGTWTPAVSFSTSDGDTSYTVRYGSYTKVGRLVTCTGFVWFSETTASGNLSLSGLPFTSLGGGTYGYGWKGVVQSTDFTGYTSFFLSVVGGFGGGTTTATIYGNAGSQLTNANTGLNTVFTFSVTYEVT